MQNEKPTKCINCNTLNCVGCYKGNCAYCHLRIVEGLDLAILDHNKKNNKILYNHLTFYVSNYKEYFKKLFC